MIVCRDDDPRRPVDGVNVGTGVATADILRFTGARVAANGTDSQSGYWSLGHFVRNLLATGPSSVTSCSPAPTAIPVRAVADGTADLAAIDVHSWRLACEHESEATDQLMVIGTTDPTPGVVCVVSWELKHHRTELDLALTEAVVSDSSALPQPRSCT